MYMLEKSDSVSPCRFFASQHLNSIRISSPRLFHKDTLPETIAFISFRRRSSIRGREICICFSRRRQIHYFFVSRFGNTSSETNMCDGGTSSDLHAYWIEV
jgi:hypothetical protein